MRSQKRSQKKAKKETQKKILLFALLLIIIGFSAYFVINSFQSSTNQAATPRPRKIIKKKKAKPAPSYSALTGEVVSKGRIGLRPLAIIVENSPAARPQNGLNNADIIYETVAEGGVTRFQAIFQSKDAEKVGPVRSMRDYFAVLVKSVDGILVHCGGAARDYAMAKQLGSARIDQFEHAKPFWRIKERRAPHNLYASTLELRKTAQEIALETPVNLSGLYFKKDNALARRGEVNDIKVNFSAGSFNVTYQYNKETNRYLRSQGVVPHTDAMTGQQLAPRNVVVIVTRIAPTYDYENHMIVETEGIGTAYVFRDGLVIKGQWERTLSSVYNLTDDQGEPIALNTGQSWFEIVKSEDAVKYPLVEQKVIGQSDSTQLQ